MDSHLAKTEFVCVCGSNILLPRMNNKLCWDLRSSNSFLNMFGSSSRVSLSLSLSENRTSNFQLLFFG